VIVCNIFIICTIVSSTSGITIDFVGFYGYASVPVLGVRYEYDNNLKSGQIIIIQSENLINHTPRMETKFKFIISDNILILTTHHVEGMYIMDVNKIGGTYIELK
jgi:hypothetical protein